VTFLHLAGARAVIEARMRARTGHFMPPAFLDSQFATLEPPGADEAAVTVDIDQPFDAVIDAAVAGVQRGSGTPP
jgi:gluconokinase